MTLEDIKKVDLKRAEILEFMIKCQELNEEEFMNYYPDIFFETDFGYGQIVQLCEGGS